MVLAFKVTIIKQGGHHEDIMTIDKEGICLTCAHTPKCALTSENCASNGTHFC